jgi:hypothetical protein
LENAVQLRDVTASIAVLGATEGAAAGPSLTASNFAFKPTSMTVRRDTRVTDNACAAGRSIG